MNRGKLKVYISGLYSGTNPQPGVGIVRSLRLAFPDAELIGVDYSNRCSGIHWQDLDDIWLQRPWEELNLEAQADEVGNVLDSGGFWISSSDLEILWLSEAFPEGHPNLLIPRRESLEKVSKPEISAFKKFPAKIPAFIATNLSDWDLHEFCRRNDWEVWLKGLYYEAFRVESWRMFENRREILSETWATDRLFLQKNVSGYEESIAFSAFEGKLLECVRMQKRDLTELNKTWAGSVSEVSEEIVKDLKKIVKRINWTGGAEIEMLRDAGGDLWLLECNPRFPAWIHGGTLAGFNLPAKLVEAASKISAEKTVAEAEEFTRIVLEVPVRPEFPLPPLPEILNGKIGHGLKHPSGLSQFAEILHRNGESKILKPAANENLAAEIPKNYLEDLSEYDFSELKTPCPLFLQKTAKKVFENSAALVKKVSTRKIKVTNAYSMKTNPDKKLMKLALEAGFFAETISALEVEKAVKAGFSTEQIIMNGPGKWWRSEHLPAGVLAGVFCDSLEELKKVATSIEQGKVKIKTLGIRLRTPHIDSRFGIPVDSPDDFQTLVEAVGNLPDECKFGIHFHTASSAVGIKNWWHLFESMLRWCSSIEKLGQRKVEILDIGGGWFPEDLQKDSAQKFQRAIETVPDFLPFVRRIFCEPGKSLAQPSMALAMRILEIRSFETGETEIIVDGSVAELPMHFYFPHRILHLKEDGSRKSLRRGESRILGRLCMESDIIEKNIEIPKGAAKGDFIVICDAGAYDRSMSYVFGRG